MRNAYNISVGKPEKRRPLGRHRSRSNNIRMNVREIVWEAMEWVHLVQDRGDQWRAVVNTVMNLRVP
jgi:hypothetical protein